MADKRTGRTQPIRLATGFIPVSIQKSMFLDDLMISLPAYYVQQWMGELKYKKYSGESLVFKYKPPRNLREERSQHRGDDFGVSLSFFEAKGRTKASSCRLSWGVDLAKTLAADYPASFAAALEYKFGQRYYNELGFSWADVGFNEQLQLKVEVLDGGERIQIEIRELYREKEEKQQFPYLAQRLGRYAIAEYLLRESEGKVSRVSAQGWKERFQLDGEVVQNVVYLLANPKTGQAYVGETAKSLGGRYSLTEANHALSDWSHFNVIPLPSGTGSDERKLIQNCVIQMMAGILEAPSRLNVQRLDSSQDKWTLVNRSVV